MKRLLAQAVIPARGSTKPPAPPRLPVGRRAPAHRDARTIRTTTVTWNAQLAQLERRAIRCWQHQPPRELTGELGTPQRNSPCKPASGTRHGDTCGCYSGYSEDTTADNQRVFAEAQHRRDYSKDTQNGA
jgi:hypothetical protein